MKKRKYCPPQGWQVWENRTVKLSAKYSALVFSMVDDRDTVFVHAPTRFQVQLRAARWARMDLALRIKLRLTRT